MSRLVSKLAMPERLHGQTLVPLLGGPGSPCWRARPAISEWSRREDLDESSEWDCVSIILDGWKLVHNTRRPPQAPEFELYDHKTDPLDQTNVVADHPGSWNDWRGSSPPRAEWAAAARLPSDEEAADGMSAEEHERLRSLGYSANCSSIGRNA